MWHTLGQNQVDRQTAAAKGKTTRKLSSTTTWLGIYQDEWAPGGGISIVWHLQAIEVWQASCKSDNVACPWPNSFSFVFRAKNPFSPRQHTTSERALGGRT